MNAQAQAILDFWFGGELPRKEWFQKSEAFDQDIAQRFGAQIELALEGGLHAWDAEGPQAALARILVLDQFCRNVYRDTPLAFAGDHQALSAALDMLDAGEDQKLAPFQRAFVYLPLEHAEDLAMQQQAVTLFTRLAEAQPDNQGLAGMLDYAKRHRDVIERFGRFPHRNAILQRASTAAELEFLKQPGSKF
ncbi:MULTISPECIES: DUF924 family protein [unclassified Duganella]|uniref:DUF924 family protein n=1 Tax=unclassified Duganella TaxID=2636909 RepID=UPI0008863EC2|nr:MULTISPECIES: DUF924 family protein [unclassified Duganella]SDG91764.1 Uncharacterized conserved protein, DUF924 family [Duganella sp. OV458]SDJ50651.1 Uncharacterized conserved protein, DUF924 family [Duganella sp. OV510]